MTASQPPRILIVDDTPQAAELMGAYLAEEDFDIAIASDGEQALRQARDWRPDLILLDVMMPRISGFEVCKQLRASPDTRDIAILMITALDQAGDVERAVEVGTDDFLAKPVNKRELLHRVRSLLRSRGSEHDLDRALTYFEQVEKPEAP